MRSRVSALLKAKSRAPTSHHFFTPSNFRVSWTPTPLITNFFFFCCLELRLPNATRENAPVDPKLNEPLPDSRLLELCGFGEPGATGFEGGRTFDRCGEREGEDAEAEAIVARGSDAAAAPSTGGAVAT
jgi:hypothetical protein